MSKKTQHIERLVQKKNLIAQKLKEAEDLLEAAVTAHISKKPVAKFTGKKCGVKGCGNRSRSLGYCGNHYIKLRVLEKKGTAELLGWTHHPKPQTVINRPGQTK